MISWAIFLLKTPVMSPSQSCTLPSMLILMATAFRTSSSASASIPIWRRTRTQTLTALPSCIGIRRCGIQSQRGGAEFVPELIHNRSGVGSHFEAVDLNHDGAMDIITSVNKGTFIFWGQATSSRIDGQSQKNIFASHSSGLTFPGGKGIGVAIEPTTRSKFLPFLPEPGLAD